MPKHIEIINTFIELLDQASELDEETYKDILAEMEENLEVRRERFNL